MTSGGRCHRAGRAQRVLSHMAAACLIICRLSHKSQACTTHHLFDNRSTTARLSEDCQAPSVTQGSSLSNCYIFAMCLLLFMAKSQAPVEPNIQKQSNSNPHLLTDTLFPLSLFLSYLILSLSSQGKNSKADKIGRRLSIHGDQLPTWGSWVRGVRLVCSNQG